MKLVDSNATKEFHLGGYVALGKVVSELCNTHSEFHKRLSEIRQSPCLRVLLLTF
jgi:hypothetical protein